MNIISSVRERVWDIVCCCLPSGATNAVLASCTIAALFAGCENSTRTKKVLPWIGAYRIVFLAEDETVSFPLEIADDSARTHEFGDFDLQVRWKARLVPGASQKVLLSVSVKDFDASASSEYETYVNLPTNQVVLVDAERFSAFLVRDVAVDN